MQETNNGIQDKAILVGLELREDIKRSMEELEQLAEAAGCLIVGKMTQKKDKIEAATFIGKGKLEELKNAAQELEADIIIFNDELSGIQLRNIEEFIDVKTIDRTILILDIFAQRAISREGKLQVELAQLKYRKARLIGIGKSLSKLGGGIGTRGPGEKKLETDKRHIVRIIEEIEKDLKESKKNRQTQRLKRKKSEIPIVALVGYTNAGKSTVMNCLLNRANKSEKSVFEKDMLFATLDTSQRSIKFDSKDEFILIDTVGFVSQLPHTLIEAFKSTLEEVLYADLIFHIVDASYEHFDFQMDVTEKVLREIGVKDKHIITVYNKIDKIEYDKNILPADREALYISAKGEIGIDELEMKIRECLFSHSKDVKMIIPFDRGDLASYISEKTKVESREYTEEGLVIVTKLNDADYNKYLKCIIEEY